MRRYKWHSILTLGLAIVLISSLAACTKPKETPYAPDFTLQTLSGETVSLSDFRGKPVMLTFWKINCAACQFQMPFTQALYEGLSDEAIAVLTINVGDSASAAQDYVTSRGLTFPVLLDRQGKAAQMYGLPGVPITFFIDSEGVMKAYKIGAFQSQEEMKSAIRSVFPSLTLEPKIETGPETGKLAPDFTLQTINGQNITLNESRGKTVLLNFWVNSCTACVDEMSYFQTVFDEQANEELVVLAINCGESSQTVKSVVDGLELTFPMLLDPDGKVCTAYKHGAPTTFLIDRNGIIKAIKDDVFQSAEEINTMLDSLL
jgi:peroxiredoxin